MSRGRHRKDARSTQGHRGDDGLSGVTVCAGPPQFLYLRFREMRANQPQAMDAVGRTVLTVVGKLTAFYAAGLPADKLRNECV